MLSLAVSLYEHVKKNSNTSQTHTSCRMEGYNMFIEESTRGITYYVYTYIGATHSECIHYDVQVIKLLFVDTQQNGEERLERKKERKTLYHPYRYIE